MNGEAGLHSRGASASPLRWLHEGARTLLMRAPRWQRLHAGPALLAFLALLQSGLTIGVTRLFMDAGAVFHWRSLLAGWAAFMLIVWACYVLRPAPARSGNAAAAPSAAHLLALIMAQSMCLTVLSLLTFAGLERAGWLANATDWVQWTPWVVTLTWSALAVVVVMLRAGERHPGRRLVAVGAYALSLLLSAYIIPAPAFWTDAKADDTKEEAPPPVFTQEVFEAQTPLLAQQIERLQPQRPGIADMYTLTFAPYEGEEVFRRESGVVNDVMAKRFDTVGRGLKLINHADEIDRMPWATPLNLQRAIDGIAETMDLEEDVLFIHLTSHGAADGELAANFWPLEVDPVTPAHLRRWLDEAGIKHRVISISACFAGNWIAPLAGDDTLVMTASDATHTSYGCGKKSALTFFGRAMYDEQLRNSTRSFEQAHAAARLVIDKREKEAGKDDGYSNPQIKVGAKIRPYLEQMRKRLETLAREGGKP
jgi:hypothetical protein